MRAETAYEALIDHAKETQALGQIAGLLSWDQEAMMPPLGAEARAEQAGALAGVIHARRTDPKVAEWLAAIDAAALDDAGRANLREIRREHERAVKVPARLTAALARTTARAHHVWAKAREARRFADFAPILGEVLALAHERASCLRAEGQSLYDALLDDYEPGATEAGIAALFDRLRPALAGLRARIAQSGRATPALAGSFPAEAQMALAREMAGVFGYDWRAGRLDLVLHPFCSGTLGDVRITTRVSPETPFDCLYSTIHEVGHAIYEQGLDPALARQPAGRSASMGVHESQSRLCENQIGRSAAFAEFLYRKMRAAFGGIGLGSARELYAAANRVAPGFIRTEADEVHYNLHILMRFDLERALISGDLAVADLEAAWNSRFAADFGREVPHAGLGVLQDVHWSAGLFGYFPTYTLGNVYAGQLARALRRDIPDMDARIARGELTEIVAWLRRKVHGQGAIHPPREVIERATGAPADETALIAYLEAKFGELYGL